MRISSFCLLFSALNKNFSLRSISRLCSRFDLSSSRCFSHNNLSSSFLLVAHTSRLSLKITNVAQVNLDGVCTKRVSLRAVAIFLVGGVDGADEICRTCITEPEIGSAEAQDVLNFFKESRHVGM
ncbi:hypothetical protein V8G54_011994, partial [Vigna mungo]